MRLVPRVLLAAACVFSAGGAGQAPPVTAPVGAPAAPVSSPAPGGAQEGGTPDGKLVLLFRTGQRSLNAENEAVLDKAARLYRDARPVIMIVSGASDSVGPPVANLLLSNERAFAVARGLVARGIPAERTQVLAKGETNPAVKTGEGVPEPQNRRVEITWSVARQ